MESIRHIFDEISRMKREGLGAEDVLDHLHRQGHGFGVAVRAMEKNFSMNRPEAERAVVKCSGYSEFAPMLDEADPTENLDHTLEF